MDDIRVLSRRQQSSHGSVPARVEHHSDAIPHEERLWQLCVFHELDPHTGLHFSDGCRHRPHPRDLSGPYRHASKGDGGARQVLRHRRRVSARSRRVSRRVGRINRGFHPRRLRARLSLLFSFYELPVLPRRTPGFPASSALSDDSLDAFLSPDVGRRGLDGRFSRRSVGAYRRRPKRPLLSLQETRTGSPNERFRRSRFSSLRRTCQLGERDHVSRGASRPPSAGSLLFPDRACHLSRGQDRRLPGKARLEHRLSVRLSSLCHEKPSTRKHSRALCSGSWGFIF